MNNFDTFWKGTLGSVSLNSSPILTKHFFPQKRLLVRDSTTLPARGNYQSVSFELHGPYMVRRPQQVMITLLKTWTVLFDGRFDQWWVSLSCKPVSLICTPKKLTWQWNITIFNRRYLFKCFFVHCHVSFCRARGWSKWSSTVVIVRIVGNRWRRKVTKLGEVVTRLVSYIFKCFHPLLGEMIPFDYSNIFQLGWFKHPPTR